MKRRILVIDDSMINLRVAEDILVKAGFEVSTVDSGAHALAQVNIDEGAASPPYDAMLLDVMMPGIDGIEVLRKVRTVWNEVQLPVIMVTSKDKSEDVMEALSFGANDYVTKPIDPGILVARLNTHLKLRDYHESLRRAQDSLMSAARIEAVGLLAAGVAHEIRNPLGRIQMAVGGLQGMVDKFPEADRDTVNLLVDTAVQSVESADKIVAGLITSFRGQTLPLQSLDIDEVIQEAIQYLNPEIHKSGVELQTDFADGAPEVAIAPKEFQQAFVAIVRNALQVMVFADSSEKQLIIQTRVETMSGQGSNEGTRSGNRLRDGDPVLTISVIDSGPGMTAEQIEQAFDAFYTTKATGAGTGLGLTVARKIIELHKGVIRLTNREDGESGLKVDIFLKIADPGLPFV